MAPFKMAPKPLTRPTTWLHPLSVPPLRAASHPGTVAQRGPLLGNLARCWALAQGSAGCHVPQEALLDCSTHRGLPDILCFSAPMFNDWNSSQFIINSDVSIYLFLLISHYIATENKVGAIWALDKYLLIVSAHLLKTK